MFVLSAVAVERDIVGSDSDAELICDDGELWRPCCCAAARRAAVADCASLLDLGEVEKYWANLFDLDGFALISSPPFSMFVEEMVPDGGKALANGLVKRRGIVRMLDQIN